MSDDNFLPFLEHSRCRQQETKRAVDVFCLAENASLAPISVDGTVLRPLSVQEISTLQKECQCVCSDWSRMRILIDDTKASEDQSSLLKERVTRNRFDGAVVISMLMKDGCELDSGSVWQKLPQGIHENGCISNCIVSIHAWVYRNTYVGDTSVDPYAVLSQCGLVSSSPGNKSGWNGEHMDLMVGPESAGGRLVRVTPETSMIDVCLQLTGKKSLPASSSRQQKNMNVLLSNCILASTPSIQDVFLFSRASIETATSVSQAVLFPDSIIRNACTAEKVMLQWGADISNHSTVTESIMMEKAHAGPHSLVASTVLGPDVHVSAGEVHCSVIGPNTNAHHQSLIISVIWPLGRGNVGYGANVGSNHTGRLPDQEATCGEGIFWGLSNVIKFPVDLTMAPYSIIAAGTTLPPQRICMPFSLVMSETDGGNSIIPGWVLWSSPFTIVRSEKKFATRRKALRHKFYTGWSIRRPRIVFLCLLARNELRRIGSLSLNALNTAEVWGIGQNRLSEKGRQKGIVAYTEFIQQFGLDGLLARLMELREKGKLDVSEIHAMLSNQVGSEVQAKPLEVAWEAFPWEEQPHDAWSIQLWILRNEFPMNKDLLAWLTNLLESAIILSKKFAEAVHKSRKRDYSRGEKIIPGYASSHEPVDQDAVVQDSYRESQRKQECIVTILKELNGKSSL